MIQLNALANGFKNGLILRFKLLLIYASNMRKQNLLRFRGARGTARELAMMPEPCRRPSEGLEDESGSAGNADVAYELIESIGWLCPF